MAETVGSLADKIIISELKIYHMLEQARRPDAGPAHRRMCRGRWEILKRQRDDLSLEISRLFADMSRGEAQPAIYRQFKMYNEPRFQMKK